MHIEEGSAAHYLVAASGALPAILAMFYFDWLDRKRPEPWGLRYLTSLVGMLCVIPALVVEVTLAKMGGQGFVPTSYPGAAFNAFCVAGATEEACKIAAVFMVVWYSKSFDERMDGLVYGARAGLGFALLENVGYIYQAAPTDQLMVTWAMRAVLAVPGHALWSGMIGYCAARRRFDKAGPGLFGGYAIAAAFHGLYDFSIFVQAPLHDHHLDNVGYVLLLTPLVLTVVGWRTVRRMARTALALDDAAEAYAKANPQPQGVPMMPMQMPMGGYPPPQYPPGQVPYYWYWPGPPPRR